jgi:hypothetical protein
MTIEKKSFTGQGAIAAFGVLVFGTADNTVALATGSTSKIIGTSDELDHTDGEQVDLELRPFGEVKLGAAVTRGDPLTSNAAGLAVTAAPAAGVNAYTFGRAGKSGVAGETIPYIRSLGVLQG